MRFPFLAAILLTTPVHADLQRYTLRVAPSLTEYTARACFPDSVPERLVTGSGRALALMRDIRARFDGVTRELAPRQGALLLPRVPDDRCLDWSVELGTLPDGTDWNSATRIGEALVVSPRLLLWRQPRPYVNGDLELRFELPPGTEVSAPWQRVSGPGAAPTFRLGATAPSWPATLMLGRFERRAFTVGGAHFELALTTAPARLEAARVQRWAEQGARAVAGVIGRFPVARVQLLVVPVHDAHEAVPDAVTARGGGAAVHAKVHAGASDAALGRDWVIVHELAHFLLPFVDRRDAWLSEGFASYYQHVLRARSGTLTPEAGWRALLAGLARGDRATRPGLTLRDAAYAPGANTMRIYWSGAALALHADVELRRQSGGRETLDTVLARFVACCREPDRNWRATELLGELDRLSGTTLFSAWHAEHIHSAFFPNLRPLYAELGIAGTPDAPRFEAAPLSGIREELMRPRTAAGVTR